MVHNIYWIYNIYHSFENNQSVQQRTKEKTKYQYIIDTKVSIYSWVMEALSHQAWI